MRKRLRDDPYVKLVRQHGYIKVQRAMNFVVAWAYCSRKLGHDPTITEYIDWWKANPSTTYRELAAFREVTALDNPRPILDRMEAAGLAVEQKPEPTDGFAVLPFLIGV